MSWNYVGNTNEGSLPKIPGIDHPCLLRRSERIYQLLDPKKPEHSDVQTFDVGQLKQFVLFDRYLRALDLTAMGAIALAVPSGYRDFASLFNKYHKGPERFATFLRLQDGMLEVSGDGLPVIWSHFKVGPSLIDGWSGSELAIYDRDSDMHQDGSDEQLLQVGKDIGDDNSYVMVERTEYTDPLNSLCERMKGTVEVIKELNQFYRRRADIERDYSVRLAELSEAISVSHATGELLASLEVLRKETITQSTIHSTLLADITRDVRIPCETAVARSSAEIRQVISSGQERYREFEHQTDASFTDGERQTKSVREWSEWPPLIQSCQKMEESRLELLKDTLWAYANLISTACVSDDESAENVRVALERFEPAEEAQRFASQFTDITKLETTEPDSSTPVNAAAVEVQDEETAKCLFYVKALYDYKATEEGDMSLTAGEIIGVISTPEDGWWQGEISANEQNPPIRGRFPSNFVTTF